jgi:hypothetical protein
MAKGLRFFEKALTNINRTRFNRLLLTARESLDINILRD